MTNKILVNAGVLLLLIGATPSVFGHDDLRYSSSDAQHRYPLPNDKAGVAGRYFGAAGPAIASEAYTNPQATMALGDGLLCNAQAIVNEEYINGHATTGLVPDGQWDDGGLGGACHSIYAANPILNAPGCYGGQRARGLGAISLDIWIGATCDWKTDVGGTNTLAAVNNCANWTTADRLVCLAMYLQCLGHPAGCGVTGSVQSCGADHRPDAINFGHGSGNAVSAIFPVATGITDSFNVNQPCGLGDEIASIYVFDTVMTNNMVPAVHPASTGVVWTEF